MGGAVGAGDNVFTPGTELSARVVQALDAAHVVVQVRGRTLVAESSVPLVPGSVVKIAVAAVGDQITARLVPPDTATAAQSAPTDARQAAALALVRDAFAQAGAPLDPVRVRVAVAAVAAVMQAVAEDGGGAPSSSVVAHSVGRPRTESGGMAPTSAAPQSGGGGTESQAGLASIAPQRFAAAHAALARAGLPVTPALEVLALRAGTPALPNPAAALDAVRTAVAEAVRQGVLPASSPPGTEAPASETVVRPATGADAGVRTVPAAWTGSPGAVPGAPDAASAMPPAASASPSLAPSPGVVPPASSPPPANPLMTGAPAPAPAPGGSVPPMPVTESSPAIAPSSGDGMRPAVPTVSPGVDVRLAPAPMSPPSRVSPGAAATAIVAPPAATVPPAVSVGTTPTALQSPAAASIGRPPASSAALAAYHVDRVSVGGPPMTGSGEPVPAHPSTAWPAATGTVPTITWRAVLAEPLPDAARDGAPAVQRALTLAGVHVVAVPAGADAPTAPRPEPHLLQHLAAAAAELDEASVRSSAAAAPLATVGDTVVGAVREQAAATVFHDDSLRDYDRVLPLALAADGQPTPARLAVARRSQPGGGNATYLRVDTELSELGPVSVRMSGLDGGAMAITLMADGPAAEILAAALPALAADLRAAGLAAGLRVVDGSGTERGDAASSGASP
jgi:hypothetical protein